jgi:hypothetical protein
MKNLRLAAFAGALIFVCAIVAWQWYARVGTPQSAAPAPVQAITVAPHASAPAVAATPAASAAPKATPTPAPVVFVPAPSTATPAPEAPVSAPTAAANATAPLEAPTPAPEGAPIPLVTLAPSAATPGVIREPTNAPPRILSLTLSTPVAHGGDVVSGFVETSSNVASVEARIGGYSSSMRKIGVGKFVLSYRVPRLPFFLHRTYTIKVIARNTRGDAVSSAVPIEIR